MKDKLIIFKLKIKSSYLQSREEPADTVFDTLQFYTHERKIFRIKTYAIDQDIHIHQVNIGERKVEDVEKFLIESTKMHYADAIEKELTLHLSGPDDQKSAKDFFEKNGMNPSLESNPGFAFWNPDNETYSTQSRPL